SVATVGRPLTSSNVLAGPSQVGEGGMGGPSGVGGPPTSFGAAGARPAGAPTGARPTGGGMGGGGGATVSTALIRYLEANQGSAKYLVAATSSHTTAPIIIATGKAVVTIGGFSGTDPAPTVSQLAAMVANGELRYVLLSGGGMGGGPGGGSSSSALQAWVKQHGTVVTGVSTSGGTLYRVRA
ncbi:MAG: glycosyl transferase family 39, partial [Solirubrobacterales bacterium]|nr:glycosyl transferase family 39 [Solirubrobacterales bacterium]